MRPPSSGAPGSRLKTPSTRFTTASHTATVGSSVPGATTASNANASTPNDRGERERGGRARDRDAELVAGGRGSELSFETPPSSQSVMPSTFWPWRRATTEWASSWARIDAKNRIDREHRGGEVGAVGVGGERGQLAAGQRADEERADHQQAPVNADLDAGDPSESNGRAHEVPPAARNNELGPSLPPEPGNSLRAARRIDPRMQAGSLSAERLFA